MKLILCMQINIKVSVSWHHCFCCKWSDISKVPKIGSTLVIFIKIGNILSLLKII